jgi:uncharacterized protein YgbK (DUF1537 family)
MACRPIIVLADDLTGAAEVGALAHEAGLRVVVVTKVPRAAIETDVLVLDTNTRLVTPGRAAGRVKSRAARLSARPHSGVFKKTDSVLRGPVLAELSACAAAFGLQRTVLVAGNPSLGRTIHKGRCYIDGQAIDQTPFARDPHHPARSAEVLDLLHAAGRADVHYLNPKSPLPTRGVIVGEHHCAADTAQWVLAVDKHTLPAGGADFFRAWLASRIPDRRRPSSGESPAGPALLLHGTTASIAGQAALLFNGLRPPPVTRVALALRQRGAAAVSATKLTLNDPAAPAQIATGFAGLALALRDAGAFRHLLIAGGATAATVLSALGWNRLSVRRVWGPGVVSLQPDDHAITITLKPGSYPWPAELQSLYPHLFS